MNKRIVSMITPLLFLWCNNIPAMNQESSSWLKRVMYLGTASIGLGGIVYTLDKQGNYCNKAMLAPLGFLATSLGCVFLCYRLDTSIQQNRELQTSINEIVEKAKSILKEIENNDNSKPQKIEPETQNTHNNHIEIITQQNNNLQSDLSSYKNELSKCKNDLQATMHYIINMNKGTENNSPCQLSSQTAQHILNSNADFSNYFSWSSSQYSNDDSKFFNNFFQGEDYKTTITNLKTELKNTKHDIKLIALFINGDTNHSKELLSSTAHKIINKKSTSTFSKTFTDATTEM